MKLNNDLSTPSLTRRKVIVILIQEVGAKDEGLTLEMSTLETHNLKNNGGNLRIVPA